jgi:predicted permease
VSWSYWKSKFNLDPAILGKQIMANDTPVTIVGVTEQGFSGLNGEMSQDLWLPLSMEPVIHHATLGWGSLGLVGRLKPGVTLQQTRAEMAVLFQSAIDAPGVGPYVREMKFEVEPATNGLSTPLRQTLRNPLVVLMALVSLVLLIACANLAGLLLAREASRRQEMAVRACLGAGRLRLVRQALTESLLLSLLGGFLGVFLAYFGGRGLLRMLTSGREILGLPLRIDILTKPDSHVLLFTGAMALLTALLCGAGPAMSLSVLPTSALQPTSRIGESKSRRLFGRSLIVAQVALSVVLLSAAALFVGYVLHLRNLNLGFRRDHLLLVFLDPDHSGYDPVQWSRLSQELLAKLDGLPGVRSATLSGMTPILGVGASSFAVVKGHPENHREVSINFVAPNYFETYGTPLLAGRDFSFNDRRGPLLAIINQAMARDYFGSASPIGSLVTLDHVTLRGSDTPTYEVTGVVGDAKYNDLQQSTPRTIYLNAFQENRIVSQLTLRTATDPEAVANAVRQTVASVLKTVPIVRVNTMADQINSAIVPERLTATLSTWFGALGALLAAVGLYGLLAYTVTLRTHEIGVRMALGANTSIVMRMVLTEAVGMVATGLMIGAPLALWTKQFANRLIPDLTPQGAVSILLGAVTMLAIAVLGAYLPARRASRIEPIVALRYE